MPFESSWSRRRFLAVASAGALVVWLPGCGSGKDTRPVTASDPLVAAREERRRRAGAGRKVVDLVAGRHALDLAGRVVQTYAYGAAVPGPEIRVRAGDELEVRFRNELTTATTIHWHGLAIRNDMDGVPTMTQAPIKSGETFSYRFVVPDPGTYWFHPHMGLDLDRGLYAPIIVEDPTEAARYDADAIVVLDDWLDGIDGASPESTYAALRAAGGMSHDMGGMGSMMSGGMGSMSDQGDVDYPLHLLNGRPAADPPTLRVAPKGRMRVRFINAGSDTLYRVAIGGQSMTVTHLDGFPVEPVVTDAVVLGMGERVDVIVQPSSGVWPVVAAPEGKNGAALAFVRTTDAEATRAPTVGDRLAEHDRRIFNYSDARATEAVALPRAEPDRKVTLALTGGMMSYSWGIDGRTFGEHRPIQVRQGERLRLELRNDTTMVHPMHLHGHTFAFAGDRGIRKDTVLIQPSQSVSVDVIADNPGQWMLHCHNTYHLEAGMATELSYVK